jgi:4-amino-4-deoxy-L-arabinose transferase-like glycosyltransferase
MKLALPAAIMAASLLVLAVVARHHTLGSYATETDFYHLYGPDAERIGAWKFPANDNKGPGYPALVALVSLVTGDVFVSGKWISVVSGALAGLLVFLLCARLFGYWAGVGAQMILLVSGPFPRFALSASTDVVFLLLCLAALLCFMNDRASARWRVASAGAVTGAAWLVRVNGIFLIPTFLLAILFLDVFGAGWRKRLELAALLPAAALIAVAPWLYANYRHNGSPFYNTTYLTVALFLYGDVTGGRINQDGVTVLSRMFHSLGDVLRYDPWRIVFRYPVNVLANVGHSLAGDLVSLPVAGLALAGATWALLRQRSNDLLLVLLAGACYVLLLGVVHWEARFYLFVAVIYAGLASYALAGAVMLARRWGRAPGLAVGLLSGAVWLAALTHARADVSSFLADPSVEIVGACGYLQQQGISGARILARKPHLPYVCRQEWVYFPLVRSLEELHTWLETHPVDFIAFGTAEQQFRPALIGLREPALAPSWLKAVWVGEDPPFVLYAPVAD